MAGTVVDELIVRLTLDAEEYSKAEKTVDKNADRTERKVVERTRKSERRDKDQQSRLKGIASSVRSFALVVSGAVGIVAGLGFAVGGVLTNLVGMDAGLRKQAVGTGMSVRAMQAWSSASRRMGADAAAGAEAIASLSKERQQFNLGVPAPTLAAFSRMGVDVSPGKSTEDILSDAQQVYRRAPDAQKQQYENSLSAQGVAPDIILMIKSDKDARAEFAKSYSQASEENRKAADAVADALESLKAQAISIASTLLTALMPAIQQGATNLAALSVTISDVSNAFLAAGGGVEGFQQALDKVVPEMGAAFRDLRGHASTLGEGFAMEMDVIKGTGEILAATFRVLGNAINSLLGWLNKVRAPWGDKGLVDDAKDRIVKAKDAAVAALGAKPGVSLGQAVAIKTDEILNSAMSNARAVNAGPPKIATAANPNPSNLPRSIEYDPPAREKGASNGKPAASDVMDKLITQYGLNTQEAAAVTANWQHESGLRTDALNTAGGGSGARGLAQWRGARSKAFQARYGVMPDKGTMDQQIEFAMTDPYEQALMKKSLSVGGSARELGVSTSKYYEAHGDLQEDARRGATAEKLAASYPAGNASSAPTVNIQNMTVQANDAQSFVGGIQRLSGSQNYTTVQR